MADLDPERAQKAAPSVGGPFLPRAETRHGWFRSLFVALTILAGIVLAWAFGVYDYLRLENLARLQLWVGGLGPWAPIVYMAAYVLLELAFVPALPLTILAGVAFGPAWGTLYAWAGATLSAGLAFLVARYGWRGTVERWVARSPRVARIDGAFARHGWRILAFTRLVPVFPFNLQNYAYGLTSIRFSTYMLVSAVFMLPGTAAFTLAGDALAEGAAGLRWLVLCFGVAALLLVLLYVVPRRLGRQSGATQELIGGK